MEIYGIKLYLYMLQNANPLPSRLSAVFHYAKVNVCVYAGANGKETILLPNITFANIPQRRRAESFKCVHNTHHVEVLRIILPLNFVEILFLIYGRCCCYCFVTLFMHSNNKLNIFFYLNFHFQINYERSIFLSDHSTGFPFLNQ